MKQSILILFLAICTLTAFAQSPKQNDIAIIKAARAAYNKAIVERDTAGITKYWRDDFVEIAGNGSYLVGKDACIADWFNDFSKSPNIIYVRTPQEIIISETDNLAWEKGKWTATNSPIKGGNYSAMWRRTENIWKLQAEMFVTLTKASANSSLKK